MRLINTGEMLAYLQDMLICYLRDVKDYGADDRMVQRAMHDMLACKQMAEALIGVPVYLQKDGNITLGF